MDVSICDKCGFCCHNGARITETDLKVIEKNCSIKGKDFLDKEKSFLKIRIVKNRCFFLKENKRSQWLCSIHEHKPKICAEYKARFPGCRPNNYKEKIRTFE